MLCIGGVVIHKENARCPSRTHRLPWYAATLILALCRTSSADDIARWTFETSIPAAAGPFAAEAGTYATSSFASGLHANAATYSSPSGNGSLHSFSSDNWSVGDYYQINTSSLGYTQLNLYLDQVSSNSGPQNFHVEYSTDGTTFHDLTPFNSNATYNALANSNPAWNATTPRTGDNKTIALLQIHALDNQPILDFRFVDTTTLSAANGTVGSSGTSRVDNILLTGVPISSTVAGDYNQNGVVDEADYVVWRDHLGQSFGSNGYLLPNDGGTSIGVVDQADYNYWRSRFGATSGAGSLASFAVPEPSTLLLLAGSLLAISNRRPEKRK